MTTQNPRYVFVQNIDGKSKLIGAPSQITIKKENFVAQQTFAQPETQIVYQQSAQMSQNSDYHNSSVIKIEKVDSLRNSVSRTVSSPYKASTSRRSLPSTTVTSSSPSPSYKRTDKKRNEKPGKGLRHFSMRVCQKVKEKGVTSYNEVADELVCEETDDAGANGSGSYDQKNIRRRVYDALNVLMAMNIISKEKKEIKWIGLPTSSAQECEEIELQNEQARGRIQEKQQQLRELILKHVSFKSLIERNKDLEKRGIVPSASSAVQLPFIVINTNKKTHINCNISNDKREYLLKFDDKFEVQDDFEVLKRMGLLLGLDKGESKPEDIEKLKKLVPKPYQKYIEMYACEEDWTMMDQTQSSFSHDETSHYETLDAEYLEEDTLDEGI